MQESEPTMIQIRNGGLGEESSTRKRIEGTFWDVLIVKRSFWNNSQLIRECLLHLPFTCIFGDSRAPITQCATEILIMQWNSFEKEEGMQTACKSL